MRGMHVILTQKLYRIFQSAWVEGDSVPLLALTSSTGLSGVDLTILHVGLLIRGTIDITCCRYRKYGYSLYNFKMCTKFLGRIKSIITRVGKVEKI